MLIRKLEEKCIKGLMYDYSESTVVEKDGQKKTQYTRKSRPLTLDDVIGEQEYPSGVSFVTNDGKKYFWDRKTGKTTKI